MGGSSEPPYLYDAPRNRPISYPYSNYDPKQVTRESLHRAMEERRPKSTQSGPLIDFNRHPDSYMIVTGSNLDHKPMSKYIKKAVAAVRWTQFAFRVIQLLVAMGALFCAIVLKPVDLTQAWIMRIAPGYDILLLAYAIYHLLRSSKARAPNSSASYHFFAIIMDVCLIPFYAFTAVFTFSEWEVKDTAFTWTSFFSLQDDTRFICFLAFIFACTLAGLHFISIGLGMYLTIVFRKIAALPPDMNPLEDNLTSRKASKHKYKNSEVTLADSVAEKKAGFYSGTTFSGSTLDLNGSRLSTATGKEPGVRQIEFGHSRMGSDMSFSPHTPNSARQSRQIQEQQLYRQPRSARQSVQTLPPAVSAASSMHTRSQSAVNEQQRKSMMHDNWYVVDGADEENLAPSPPRQSARIPQVAVASHKSSFIHEPLGMNPPTPKPEKQQDRNALGEISINRSLTVTSDNTVTSSVYSESAPSLNTPKRKYYGDLAAAARGVRGYAQLPQAEDESRSPSPGKKQNRVISRSGADIADERTMFIPEKNTRRRMVSGKAAEEGLGGYW